METSEWCHQRDSFVVYVCDEFIVRQTRTKLLLQFFVSSSNRGMRNIVRDELETWQELESNENLNKKFVAFVRILISCCISFAFPVDPTAASRIKILILQLQLFVTTIRSRMKHVFWFSCETNMNAKSRLNALDTFVAHAQLTEWQKKNFGHSLRLNGKLNPNL